MKIVTIERGRQVAADQAEATRRAALQAVDLNRQLAREERLHLRPLETPDRASVRRAILVVEMRLVDAVWTLARLPDRSPFSTGRCGVPYIPDPEDRFTNAVANGGKWEQRAPRPAAPSGRAIDAMEEPLAWLALLERAQARLVSLAAGTKRGDVRRHVSWTRVRIALPETQSQSIRTLQRRYDDGLRQIVAALA